MSVAGTLSCYLTGGFGAAFDELPQADVTRAMRGVYLIVNASEGELDVDDIQAAIRAVWPPGHHQLDAVARLLESNDCRTVGDHRRIAGRAVTALTREGL